MVTNLTAIIFTMGRQGGTVDDVARELGVTVNEILNADDDQMGDLLRMAQKFRNKPQWKPIETAPKDGTNILLGKFDPGNSWCCSSFFLNDRWVGQTNKIFTHWMPFPEYVNLDATDPKMLKKPIDDGHDVMWRDGWNSCVEHIGSRYNLIEKD